MMNVYSVRQRAKNPLGAKRVKSLKMRLYLQRNVSVLIFSESSLNRVFYSIYGTTQTLLSLLLSESHLPIFSHVVRLFSLKTLAFI